MCERLEAESRVAAATQPERSASPNNKGSATEREHSAPPKFRVATSDNGAKKSTRHSSNPLTNSHDDAATTPTPAQETSDNGNRRNKRAREAPSGFAVGEVVDLSRDSPEPESPASKRSKDKKQNGEKSKKIPTPFFEDPDVRRRLARGSSPPAPGHVSDPRNQAHAGSKVKRNGIAAETASQTKIKDSPSAGNSLGSSGSSSDDDVPLASFVAPFVAQKADKLGVTPVLAAVVKMQDVLVKVHEALADLEQKYRLEMECNKGRLAEKELLIAERDLIIDQLRAKLRSRPAKKSTSSSDSQEA